MIEPDGNHVSILQLDNLKLYIGAYSPSSIPMNRLAQYMTEFAKLLGEPERVHFSELSGGSTGVHARIDDVARPKVGIRLEKIRSNDMPIDAERAVYNLNKMLREDNASGSIMTSGGAEIIPFPGIKQPLSGVLGPFEESTSIDGLLIKVGGKDESIPFTLISHEGKEYNGNATRSMAREMAQHLFGYIRCNGTGAWRRDENGEWQLKKIIISDFVVLEDSSLEDDMLSLKNIRAEWPSSSIWENIQRFREEDNS